MGPEDNPDGYDELHQNQPLLSELYRASIAGRIGSGRRAGLRVTKLGDEIDWADLDSAAVSGCACISGFSVHAGVGIPAHDRMRLERLCRYGGCPPVATERLSLLPDGRLLYRLKRRWRDGTSHIIFEPLDLVGKLAALVPPPRFNLVRYHGVLAASAAWRPLVIPEAADGHGTYFADEATAVTRKSKIQDLYCRFSPPLRETRGVVCVGSARGLEISLP